MDGRRLLGVLLALGVSALPTPVAAQVATGLVVERDGSAPVVGALVRLLDAEGREVSTFVTPADGRYRLEAPGGGVYWIAVERIGVAAVRLGPVAVREAGVTPFDVAVASQPVRLEGLTVEGERRLCRSDTDEGPRVQALWDDIRTALAVTSWTERTDHLELRVRRHSRELAPGDLALLREETEERTGRDANSLYSLSAEELDREGYVRTGRDGSITYYGPDAEALLSDAFLASHCFHLVPAREDDPSVTGLGFRPLPGRDRPDVEGVLWVEESSRRLDRLDFRYTGLPAGPGDGLASGHVSFTALPDGRWMVDRWRLRMPVVGLVRGTARGRTVERRMVTAVREVGARVLSARGEGYTWTPDMPTWTVAGTVWDSLSSRPLADAEVRLAGRGWVGRTDARGRFALHEVPTGRYRITFDHPLLDSLAHEPAWRTVDVPGPGGGRVETELALPSRTTLLSRACIQEEIPVLGQVRDPATGGAVPGAVVEIRGARGPARRVPVEADGWYVSCHSGEAGTIRAVARLGPLASEVTEASTPSGGSLRLDLDLSLTGAAERRGDPEGSGPPVVWGTVVDADGGRPLDGALVELLDDTGAAVDRSLSDGRGRFRLTATAPGPHRIRAERLGHRELRSDDLELAGERRVELRMATGALEIEGMVVTVEARVPHLERAGYYRRQRFFRGTFLPREVLERSVPVRTSDILFRHTSARPFDMASRTGNTTDRWFQFRSASRAGRNACLPAVYIDGGLARKGWISLGSPLPPGYPTLDALVSPEDIEALEVYETQVPVSFSGGGGCGVVVVWRKQGLGS